MKEMIQFSVEESDWSLSVFDLNFQMNWLAIKLDESSKFLHIFFPTKNKPAKFTRLKISIPLKTSLETHQKEEVEILKGNQISN